MQTQVEHLGMNTIVYPGQTQTSYPQHEHGMTTTCTDRMIRCTTTTACWLVGLPANPTACKRSHRPNLNQTSRYNRHATHLTAPHQPAQHLSQHTPHTQWQHGAAQPLPTGPTVPFALATAAATPAVFAGNLPPAAARRALMSAAASTMCFSEGMTSAQRRVLRPQSGLTHTRS